MSEQHESFLEPPPDVQMDEYVAQNVLRRPCPVCHAENGFSCTTPVEVDFEVKRKQTLSFHRDRLPADMPGFEGTWGALESLTRSRSRSGDPS